MAPKTMGGLGISSLRSANLALLEKWWWKAKVNGRGLWWQVIYAIHSNRVVQFLPCSKYLASPWKAIGSVEKDLGEMGINFTDCFSSLHCSSGPYIMGLEIGS
jgi:hypothetical protein